MAKLAEQAERYDEVMNATVSHTRMKSSRAAAWGYLNCGCRVKSRHRTVATITRAPLGLPRRGASGGRRTHEELVWKLRDAVREPGRGRGNHGGFQIRLRNWWCLSKCLPAVGIFSQLHAACGLDVSEMRRARCRAEMAGG